MQARKEVQDGDRDWEENFYVLAKSRCPAVLLENFFYDNEDDVMDALNKDHFQVTKLASTGGFLRKGNSTLMIATQDDMVDECIELIKKQCGKRQKITVNMPYVSGTSMGTYTTMPMPVEIGGATIMVVDLDRFEKY